MVFQVSLSSSLLFLAALLVLVTDEKSSIIRCNERNLTSEIGNKPNKQCSELSDSDSMVMASRMVSTEDEDDDIVVAFGVAAVFFIPAAAAGGGGEDDSVAVTNEV